MRFAHPYFVTPHAVRRYQERVEPGVSAAEAITAIQAALQQPERRIPLPDGRGVENVWVRDRFGRTFRAVVGPPGPGREWPVVRTVR